MRLTTPLDLPAPGRHQALYVILRFQQSPKFVLNSHDPHFTAAFSRRGLLIPALLLRRPLFRSYGASLPSSLTKVISRTLVFSTRPPVSDYGTVMTAAPAGAFLGSRPGSFRRSPALVSVRPSPPARICLRQLASPFPPDYLPRVCLRCLRPSCGDDAAATVPEC